MEAARPPSSDCANRINNADIIEIGISIGYAINEIEIDGSCDDTVDDTIARSQHDGRQRVSVIMQLQVLYVQRSSFTSTLRCRGS